MTDKFTTALCTKDIHRWTNPGHIKCHINIKHFKTTSAKLHNLEQQFKDFFYVDIDYHTCQYVFTELYLSQECKNPKCKKIRYVGTTSVQNLELISKYTRLYFYLN